MDAQKSSPRCKKYSYKINFGNWSRNFESITIRNHSPYDIIEPFTELYAYSPFKNRIRNINADIDEIASSQTYDRITSIATFEHVLDLPKVVAKSALLLNEGGLFRVATPNEGTVFWKLGWKLTTGIEFKLKYGLNYGTLMKHEHVNTANEIEEILFCFF